MMDAVDDEIIQVQRAVEHLLGGDVAVAVTDPRVAHPDLMEGELPAVAGAIAARHREFAAGRAAVRRAMADLGLAPVAIPAAADRAPVWPDDVIGSISHSDTICIAVVALSGHLRALGIDIEAATPLDTDMITTICSATEQARIAGKDQGMLAKLLFSAKEAAYKAQYPLSGLLFGFDHLDIVLDPAAGTFTATFLKPAPPFQVGCTLPGRFVQVADILVTAVVIGQNTAKGA